MERGLKERGITLVALVITIIILIILSTVTINTILGKYGLINQASITKNTAENFVASGQENIDKILNEYTSIMDENQYNNYTIDIDSNLITYNQSLGESNIIYKVVGKIGEKTVYENLINGIVDTAGNNMIQANIDLLVGTTLTIQPVYYSPSYDLISDETVTIEMTSNNTQTVNFNYEYNGKLISTSYVDS